MKFDTVLPIQLFSVQRENTPDNIVTSLETICQYVLEDIQGKLSTQHPYVNYRNDFVKFDEAVRNTDLPAELRAKVKGLYSVVKALLEQFKKYTPAIKAELNEYLETLTDKSPFEKISLLVQELKARDSTKDSVDPILHSMLNLG